MQRAGVDLSLMVDVECFEGLFLEVPQTPLALVDFFRNGEDHEEDQREGHAIDGSDLLGEQIGDGDQAENQGGCGQADGNFHATDLDVERELVFLVVALKAEHEHAHGLEEEAPHYAKRASLAEPIDIAAAEEDGGNLQQDDGVDDAIGGAEALVRLAEPIEQHAVFGDAVHDAVGADDGGVEGAGENEHADDDHKDVEQQLQQLRTGEVHGQSAEEVVGIQIADVTGADDHGGHHGDDAGADHCVPAHDIRGDAQILHLRIGDLAIDLREGFKSTHGEKRMAEGDNQRNDGNGRPEGTFEPT